VADAPLSSLTITAPHATEGIGTGSVTVATFTDANTGAAATDFTATVTWGDGNSSAASVVATGTAGVFAVLASHTYADEGTDTLSVSVLDIGGASVAGSVTVAVADATLSSLTIHNPSATEGITVSSFTVASFTDANTGAPASDFTATVSWGDGTSSAASVVASGTAGVFDVVATHKYAEETVSPITLSVQVLDTGSSTISNALTISVADATLSNLTIHNPSATEGITISSFTVASFTDANTGAPVTDFTATVSWGDGTTSTLSGAADDIVAGTVAGTFELVATHTYTTAGTFTLSADVLDVGGASVSGNITISVAGAPLSSLTISNPSATEGIGVSSFTVATFTDANHSAPASDFTATVSWGDGSTSAASVVATGTAGVFDVVASHTYAEETTSPISLSVDVLSVTGPTIHGALTISVSDAALSNLVFNNPNATAGTSTGTFTVATFHDANLNAPASDFTATITWGDGTSSVVSGTGGVVVGLGNGDFAVLASHTYGKSGPFTVGLQLADVGGASNSGSTGISAAAAPSTAPTGLNALIQKEVLLGLEMVVFYQATGAAFPSLLKSINTQLGMGGYPVGEALMFVEAGTLVFPGLDKQVGMVVDAILANPVYMTPTGFLFGAATYNLTFAYVNGYLTTGMLPSMPSGLSGLSGLSSGLPSGLPTGGTGY
jgi:hypothetical protein